MKLILIRGLPGSGKSTVAESLLNSKPDYIWFEADHYFLNDDGEYIFDVNSLHAAHQWCQRSTRDWLVHGASVVVSNTFTTIKELKPYFEIAKEFGIVPNVIHCQNQFDNEHNVPAETLEKMKARWTDDLTTLFEMVK